jgi:hypothetical protein
LTPFKTHKQGLSRRRRKGDGPMTNVPEVIDLYTYTQQTYALHVCVLFSSRKNRQAERRRRKKESKVLLRIRSRNFIFFAIRKTKTQKSSTQNYNRQIEMVGAVTKVLIDPLCALGKTL